MVGRQRRSIARSQKKRVNRTKESNGLFDDRGRTNGLTNGLGRVNGLTNGFGRVNGLVNGMGRVNGLVNGRGRVNGLVNGRGRVNGLVNGEGAANGIYNGNGYLNGDEFLYENGFPDRPEDIERRRPSRRRLVLLRYSVIVMALMFLFSVSISMIPEEPRKLSRITIDGHLDDWAGVAKQDQATTSANPDIDLKSYSLVVEEGMVSFLVEVRGQMLGDTQGYDAVYMFVDSDGSESTGYLHNGLGIDYAVEIYGGDNSVVYSGILKFQSSDQTNWSAFHSIGKIESRTNAGSLEAQIPARLFGTITEYSRFSFHTNDFDGGESYSSIHLGKQFGALEVTQERIVNNCVLTTIPQNILRLTFVAKGSGVSVDSVGLSLEGQGQLSTIAPFTLQPSETAVKIVSLSSLTATPGELISVSLTSIQADRAVTIHGDGARCYYQTAPSVKRIDGWFGDWTSVVSSDPRNLPIDNMNLDIREYSSAQEVTLNETFFYTRTYGNALEGGTPRKVEKPLPGGEPGPSPAPPAPTIVVPKKTGQDFLRIYIDCNSSDEEGARIRNYQMWADFMIQITGMNGEILNRSVFVWQHRWVYLLSVSAEKNRDSIEASVPSWVLSTLDNTSVLFEMTNWKGWGDSELLQTSWQSRSGTRAVHVVQTTTSSATTTAYSTQRKLFNDGAYFWSFYYDGGQGDTMYEYSSDGMTWTDTPAQAFSTSGVNYASLWYDSANSAVYIVGDTSASDTTIIVRKGTVSGTSISWGNEYTVTVSNSNLASKVAYISMDSSGYLWIISSSQETNYNCAAVRSTNTDDVSVWESRTIMRTAGDVSNNYVLPMILPLSGGDMYAIWYADGNIEGRGYDGSGSSWDANEVSIASTSAGKTNRGPSAVVDSSDTVHLIYSDSSGYIKYRYKTSSGSWTDGLADPEGSVTANGYPTLSILTSNDNLYACYIRSSQIYCKEWDGSSWTSITLTTDTVPKTHLSSVYSAPDNWKISWQWRAYHDFDGEYRVTFEKIPEFSNILLPCLSILLVIVITRKLRNGREDRQEAPASQPELGQYQSSQRQIEQNPS
ncbi:MAG: hypothetical protein E3J35_02990 [Methanomassiliicoccales archaeon]|nr:MAG: hypothetical protein E3J35_02990 [Methanomassiliicoccales archaeon]